MRNTISTSLTLGLAITLLASIVGCAGADASNEQDQVVTESALNNGSEQAKYQLGYFEISEPTAYAKVTYSPATGQVDAIQASMSPMGGGQTLSHEVPMRSIHAVTKALSELDGIQTGCGVSRGVQLGGYEFGTAPIKLTLAGSIIRADELPYGGSLTYNLSTKKVTKESQGFSPTTGAGAGSTQELAWQDDCTSFLNMTTRLRALVATVQWRITQVPHAN